MQKSKLLISFIAVSVFLIISWCCYTIPVVNNCRLFMSDKQILLDSIFFNYSLYEGRQTLVVINILPLAYILNYLIKQEQLFTIIRCKSREVYIKKKIAIVVVYAFLFTFSHEIINIIGLSFIFDFRLLSEMHIYKSTLINIFPMFIYYVQCGLLIILFNLIFNPKFSPLILLIINFLQVFILSKIISIRLPYMDSTILYDLVTNIISTKEIILLIVKGLIINTLLLFICKYTFSSKDLLNNEK